MPTPKSGESKSEWMPRCISYKIHEGKHPNTPEGRKAAAGECSGIYDSWKEKNMSNKSERVLLKLNCCATLNPVFEAKDNDDEFSIGLTESTILVGNGTYNGVYFPAEEIEKAFHTWNKQPININHSSNVEDEVGYITKPRYDTETKQFKVTPVLNKETAKFDVADGYIRNRIKAGKPPEVSVGVWIDREFEETDDGDRLTARNLHGDHLALVCRGACSPEAGCGIGLEKIKPSEVKFTFHLDEVPEYEEGNYVTTMVDNSGDDFKQKLKIELLKEKIKKIKLNLEEN